MAKWNLDGCGWMQESSTATTPTERLGWSAPPSTHEERNDYRNNGQHEDMEGNCVERIWRRKPLTKEAKRAKRKKLETKQREQRRFLTRGARRQVAKTATPRHIEEGGKAKGQGRLYARKWFLDGLALVNLVAEQG